MERTSGPVPGSGLKDAGVTKVECPDAQTMIAYTTDPSDRILQTYLPIIPQHIWGTYTYKTIGDAKFVGPLVGTGPYTAAEWQTSQYVRFVRNPYYWGHQGAEDEIVMQFYKTDDTMVQALQGRRARLRARPERGPAQGARGPAEHQDGRRRLERLDPARLQRVRRHEGAEAQCWRRAVDPGALGSRLP